MPCNGNCDLFCGFIQYELLNDCSDLCIDKASGNGCVAKQKTGVKDTRAAKKHLKKAHSWEVQRG